MTDINSRDQLGAASDTGWTQLAEIRLSSEAGHERLAMELVADVAKSLLPETRLERLKTAVAEAALNAIEHGNRAQPDWSVFVRVFATPGAIVVRVLDFGSSGPITRETPDLDAKLAGEQSPRGWGLFLIEEMVDEVHIVSDEGYHSVELVMHLGEGRGDEHRAV